MRGLSLLLGTAGIIAGILAWRILAAIIPVDPAGASMAVRLGLAAGALLPAAAVLSAMIAAQIAVRFWQGVFDPTAGKDGHFLRVNQRVITNTVEQMTILGPSLLALAAGAPAQRMAQVIALALAFAVARLVFWAGYLIGPMWRAPGMAASYFCTLASLGWAVALWLWSA